LTIFLNSRKKAQNTQKNIVHFGISNSDKRQKHDFGFLKAAFID